MPEEPEVFKKLAEAEAAPDLSVPFTGSYEMNQQIIEHKTWLKTIRHEKPSPKCHYRVGIYIRYFNQTKHDNYARALEALAEKDAGIVPRILSGQYKIAHKNVSERVLAAKITLLRILGNVSCYPLRSRPTNTFFASLPAVIDGKPAILLHRTSQHSISACLEVLQTNVIIIIITTSHR